MNDLTVIRITEKQLTELQVYLATFDQRDAEKLAVLDASATAQHDTLTERQTELKAAERAYDFANAKGMGVQAEPQAGPPTYEAVAYAHRQYLDQQKERKRISGLVVESRSPEGELLTADHVREAEVLEAELKTTFEKLDAEYRKHWRVHSAEKSALPNTEVECSIVQEAKRKVEDAERSLAKASDAFNAAQALDQKLRSTLSGIEAKLPADVIGRPVAERRLMATLITANYTRGEGWYGSGYAAESVIDPPEYAGIIRSEIFYPGGVDPSYGYTADGHKVSCYGHNSLPFILEVVFNLRDPLYIARTEYEPRHAAVIIPPSHIHLHLHELVPFDRSPLDLEMQREIIQKVRELPRGQRAWTMLGPAGCGKTAFAAAWLHDEITLRMADGASEPCVWRVRVGGWIDEIGAWETRTWGDCSVSKPTLPIEAIISACKRTGLTPVMQLEELDRFQPTERRLNYLNSLVNQLYEMNGLIIVTTNETLEGLGKKLDPSTLRRLTGVNDEDGRFSVFNLHQVKRRTRNT